MDRQPSDDWQPTLGWQLSRPGRWLSDPHARHRRQKAWSWVSLVLLPLMIYLFFTGRLDWFFGWPVWAWVLTGTVMGLASLAFTLARHRRGSSVLAGLAREHGWSFGSRREVPEFCDALANRWNWEPFGIGRPRIHSVLTGQFRGRSFAAFNYRYSTDEDSAATYMFGVVTVLLPVALPRMEVLPEYLIGTVAPGLLRMDVDLENEAFNRRYRVSCDNRKYAVDVLNPRAVAALLSVPPFRMRIDGFDLIAFSPAITEPADVLRKLEVLSAVADHMPSFVQRDHGVPTSYKPPGQQAHRQNGWPAGSA